MFGVWTSKNGVPPIPKDTPPSFIAGAGWQDKVQLVTIGGVNSGDPALADPARITKRIRTLLRALAEGKAVAPHAILEVRTATGELVWRFDRDGPKPRQAIPRQVALDMNTMLNSAAEQGTGRRAMLDGIHIAGKTGTTNAHRDAWFVAFTGNLVAGVWFGNDDYQSMQKMTGGSLPAMTWNACSPAAV